MAGSSETNPGGTDGANGRGKENGGAGPGGVRGMADITRLFMAGAREGAKRVPPGRHQEDAKSTARLSSPKLKDQEETRTNHGGTEARRTEGGGGEKREASNAERESSAEADLRAGKAVGGLPTAMVMLTTDVAGDGGGACGGIDGVVMAAKALAGVYGVALGVAARDGEMLHVGRVVPMGVAEDGGTGDVTGAGGVGVAVEAASEVAVARSLYRLRERVAHWLVALPGETGGGARVGSMGGAGGVGGVDRRLLEASADWVVVSGLDSDGVIACYRALKAACGAVEAGERRIRLMLHAGDDPNGAGGGEAAVGVHARLNQVARDFLGQELMLTVMGDETMDGVLAEAVATFDLAEAAEGEEAGLGGVWESVVDLVRDLNGEAEEEDAAAGAAGAPGAMEEEDLGRVLEEGEREALLGEDRIAEGRTEPRRTEPQRHRDTEDAQRGDREGDGARETMEERQVERGAAVGEVISVPSAVPVAREEGGSAAEVNAGTPGGVAGLPVFEGSAWEVMERAAVELVAGGVVLEARPPLGGRGLLMAQRGGRIHLWCLVEAGGGAGGGEGLGWAALWGWAREHRELIALTRRDLAINALAEVAVHVVVGGAAGAAGMMGAMGGTAAGVRWYRMLAVRWGEKTGMVVVPA